MALLTSVDAQRIEQAIAAVERQTAGELVVMVVPRSARYDGPRALATGLWTVALAVTTAHWGYWYVPLHWILFAQLLMGAAIWTLLGWSPLQRFLIPQAQAAATVHGRALQAFIERGVHETRDRSGLLIFVSELERRVQILGDRGIHDQVGSEGWPLHVQRIIEAIRSGRPADGIIDVIEDLGRLMAEAFPPRPDDTNELPDAVVQ